MEIGYITMALDKIYDFGWVKKVNSIMDFL